MTLIASTRVPDGIAIAADSISTITMGRKVVAKGKTMCPHCNQEHDFDAPIDLPMGPGITSTLPYAQKLQPILSSYGVGSYGSSILAGKTVFTIIRRFEQQEENEKSHDLLAVADRLGNYLHNEVKKETDVSAIPKDVLVVGCQVVGYHDEKPLTVLVKVGKEISKETKDGFGTTVSGETFVAANLWNLKGLGPHMEQLYPAWSLQDAADYCEFLVDTTAKFERFANRIPTVGGEVDIAYVSPENKFKWIRRKQLASMLMDWEDRDAGTNKGIST